MVVSSPENHSLLEHLIVVVAAISVDVVAEIDAIAVVAAVAVAGHLTEWYEQRCKFYGIIV